MPKRPPPRTGVTDAEWERIRVPYERARDRDLRRRTDLTDQGGQVVIWYRTAAGVAPNPLRIQPGVADDLPSLLSTLAVEIAWPGVTAARPPLPGQYPEQAVALWGRVWQVREQEDLRLLMHWDVQQQWHGSAELVPREGPARPLLTEQALLALLQRVATHPQASMSPHGLLLAGNRALEAGDFDAARACYTAALRDLPCHPEIHHNLAIALVHLENWEDATTMMRQARDLAPGDPALDLEYLAVETNAGIHAARANDLPRAAEHFMRILSIWPEEPTALSNLGNIRLREHREREARAIFRRFLRLHPNHAAAKEIRLALDALD